jgi:hypothetical protein
VPGAIAAMSRGQPALVGAASGSRATGTAGCESSTRGRDRQAATMVSVASNVARVGESRAEVMAANASTRRTARLRGAGRWHRGVHPSVVVVARGRQHSPGDQMCGVPDYIHDP